jgi:hypothetical protein
MSRQQYVPGPVLEAALALVARLVEVAPAYRALNDQARALQGEFASYQAAVDESVYRQVIALVDAVLGNDAIGSYFIHECQIMVGGGSVADNKRVWPLRTVEDLRAYVARPTDDPSPLEQAEADGAKTEYHRLMGILGPVVKSAAERFDLYAVSHRAKGTPEADQKAAVNDQAAKDLRAALAKAMRHG